MVDNRRTRYNPSKPQDSCPTACSSLKKKLKAVEFSIIDTVLYLDAYPSCQKALNYYNKLVKEREMLLESINHKCGPMTIFDNKSCDSWDWTDGPWPWEPNAN